MCYYYLLTYLHTPWSRDLLEKLTGSAASQEIPRIFGNRRFLTVLTSGRHLSLSWANSIQSPQPPPTSWRSILILSSHLRLGLPNGLFPSGFLTRRICVVISEMKHADGHTCPAQYSFIPVGYKHCPKAYTILLSQNSRYHFLSPKYGISCASWHPFATPVYMPHRNIPYRPI